MKNKDKSERLDSIASVKPQAAILVLIIGLALICKFILRLPISIDHCIAALGVYLVSSMVYLLYKKFIIRCFLRDYYPDELAELSDSSLLFRNLHTNIHIDNVLSNPDIYDSDLIEFYDSIEYFRIEFGKLYIGGSILLIGFFIIVIL